MVVHGGRGGDGCPGGGGCHVGGYGGGGWVV